MSLYNDADVVAPGRPAATTRPALNQVLAIVCVATSLASLDLFVVNVDLPNIARDFRGASLDDLSWILNGYAIAYAVLLVFFRRPAARHFQPATRDRDS
jgi:MFS family permease